MSDFHQGLYQIQGQTVNELKTLIHLLSENKDNVYIKRIQELEAELRRLKKSKRYGLVWEDKPEDVVERCKNELPVLVEDDSKRIIEGGDDLTHILIEGDNYHALSVLAYTHEKRIDVIYIEPPYNTGASDWKYNNNYVDINDTFRHSKWIEFMGNRLRIAKRLLSDSGVLIVAIDDNELATLSLLLDEIFPSKIKNTVVIVNNPHGVARAGFSRCHEYAIFLLNPGESVNKKPAKEDIREINLRRSGNNSLRQDSPTMFYPIFIQKSDLTISGVGEVPDKNFHPESQVIDKGDYFELWPIDSKGIEKNWYYSRKRVLENGTNELFIKTVKGNLQVCFHHSNNGEQAYKSFWIGSEYDAGLYGSGLIKNIIDSNFPFPKSLYSVKECLMAVLKNENAIILDFFAGSGTTGHAVLELNKEDGGKRQFILCTNNENKIAEEVTYQRIRNVINGYADVEGIPANLRYYKTDFIGVDKSIDDLRGKFMGRCTDMLQVRENTFLQFPLSNNGSKAGWKGESEYFRIFQNTEKLLVVMYHPYEIETFKKWFEFLKEKESILENSNVEIHKEIVVYIFSMGGEIFEEELAHLSDRIRIEMIPDEVLETYKKIFGF